MSPVLRPQEVAPGVEAFAAITPTLLPATHTNSYALGTREIVLVEPATPFLDEQREWLAWTRGLAGRGRSIVALVATHHHEDHVGGAADLARELNLPLWGHARTAALANLPLARHLGEGDEVVLDGPTPQKWRVLHTPGHASDHICLLEDTLGVAVVGDMVASVGTILVAPGDGHMATYVAQLERLAGVGARVALPAHGAPITAPEALFRRYIGHRLAREKRVLDVLTAAPQTLDDMLPIAYFDAPPAIHPIARLSLRAHLDKLVEEGRARMLDDERFSS